jgi:hypothetical protein
MHFESACGEQAALTYIKRPKDARSPSDSARAWRPSSGFGVNGADGMALSVPLAVGILLA